MTSEQVANLFGVKRDFIRKLCAAGRIVDPATNKPVERQGRDWYIPRPFWRLDARGGGFKVYGLDEREAVLMVRTRKPAKWRLVDLDTGEVFRWLDGALVPDTDLLVHAAPAHGHAVAEI